MEIGRFTLTCTKETETHEFVLREFELTNTEEVSHFVTVNFLASIEGGGGA